jgi:hypothetical protein
MFSVMAFSRWSECMPAQLDPQKKAVFKNPFLYSLSALGIATLVVGWILAARWEENRGIEKHVKE